MLETPHHHSDQKEPHNHSEGNIKLAFWLNAVFSLIELAGGIITNSMAVLSDAVHDAGDSVALGVAWYFQRVSKRKRDKTYSFGYKRFSVLGALINSLILLSGSCIILLEAVPRLYNPKPVHAGGMLLLAFLGIAVNGLAMIKTRKGNTQNERVISLHFLEDVLGWIAVLVVAITLHFYDIPILDPLLSIAITLFILYRLFGNLRITFRILLQGIPGRLETEQIREVLLNLPSVADVHDIHLWTMDGNYHVATLHLEVEEELSLQESLNLKASVRNELKKLSINHTTIEIELKGQNCIMNGC